MKRRAYRFKSPNGKAPYDRDRERKINRRLSEELNKPKTKTAN